MTDQTSSKASSGACAVCGQALASNAPGGLCPSCLLAGGIDLATRSAAKPGDFIPPAPEELDILFPEFRIVTLIGRGGMGAVYQAVQREVDRTVAIKLLPPETAKDGEFMERFRREAATLARLDHPGIVRLFDYGQRDDFAYFVMEYVDGIDLAQRMRAGPMPPEDALAVVSQLCDALQHSHERGVVHRDLKPANILLGRDGRVRLADFGLARLVQPELGESGLTRTGARLGTPRYMAPEQMSGSRKADHRVDVYALGVVVYEMLTSHLPVGHFDPPSEKIPALTPRIDAAVLRALQAEPERRYGSMTEVKTCLTEAIARPGLTRSERRRQLAWRVLLASLVAAALGAGAVLLWPARYAGPAGSSRLAPERTGSGPHAGGRLMTYGGAPCPLANERVSAVVVGGALQEFGLALLPDGSVRAWGDNRYGQTEVPSGLEEVLALAAGQGTRCAHALALRQDGTVVGWGDNTYMQARPPAAIDHVVAIAAGEFHSLALTREGRVVAWGNRSSPATAVPKNLPPARGIAAGADFSVALLASGRATVWGLDDAGQCQAPQLADEIVEVAAGQKHVLARLGDGRVIAWGDNRSQQCEVPAGLPAAIAVFAGGDGSAALDGSGRVHAWGKVAQGVGELADPVASIAIGSATWAVVAREREEPGQ